MRRALASIARGGTAGCMHAGAVVEREIDVTCLGFRAMNGSSRIKRIAPMPKSIEHVHWPDAPDLWMPYAPAIKVKGGTTVYLAGVTAAPVYHHHPHRPEEFDAMPRDMAGQARAALENLKRGLDAVGATFADIVKAERFVTDLSDQDALNRAWADYFQDAKPTTTTVQVVRLATDPRCLVEINAVAVID
jgi:enamine deaminase RidA (YjgF/YER057c/UK114 family)